MVTNKVSLTLLFETNEEKIFTDGKGSLVTVKTQPPRRRGTSRLLGSSIGWAARSADRRGVRRRRRIEQEE